ncbi:MAG: universal stress protein UspA [Planctomycetia bacterium 21-64-5]|nr:MAG: universal stress protein UspA [Planctomycetia bacterium 21-64-5]HQU42269.1 universal stress protein [Pirellulales bacterium]
MSANWLPKQRVVVPVDFSDESFEALDTALQLVPDASHVSLIYVLPVLDPAEPGVIWTTVDDESRRHHAELALAERLDAPCYTGVKTQIAFGDPGHEIADFAQREHAELIVLSSHGRTGLTRLLIGSVAEKTVRLAHCPVLVLKK